MSGRRVEQVWRARDSLILGALTVFLCDFYLLSLRQKSHQRSLKPTPVLAPRDFLQDRAGSSTNSNWWWCLVEQGNTRSTCPET